MRQMYLSAMIVAAMLLGVRAASAADDDTDKIFLQTAAVHGLFEQQLAEVGAQQASDQQVKQFAQMMAEDHKNANDQLKQVAQKVGADIPSSLPEMKRKEL